jgi:hypothetical protein
MNHSTPKVIGIAILVAAAVAALVAGCATPTPQYQPIPEASGPNAACWDSVRQ